jgi:uncharacterized protein YndB with AHSA1/START domain
MTIHPTTIDAPPGLPFIDVTREFDASPELVLRAWTDPELVVQWLGPRQATMRIDAWDARTGGAYAYTHIDRDGAKHGFRGVFHTVSPNALVQTFEYLGAPGEVSLDNMRIEAAERGTMTRLRSVFASLEARDAAVASGMADGITQSMERLDELCGQVRS